MKNNVILQMGGSATASILGGTMLRNPFLAVKNDISIPASDFRADTIRTSEKVLRIVGFAEMTAANCTLFRKAACAAWHGQADVEIDLSETTSIDCAGLGALIAVRKLTQGRNGVARLMNPTSSVQQMLDLTRTGELFDIINSADDGLVSGPAAHN